MPDTYTEPAPTPTPTEGPGVTPTAAWVDPDRATVRTESVDPLRDDDADDVTSVPATVLDVVLAGSPGRQQPGTPPPVLLSVLPTNGPTGSATALQWFGSGYTAASKVQYTFAGGAQTDVAGTTFVDGTRITGDFTPAQAGIYVFSVLNPDGQRSAIANWSSP